MAASVTGRGDPPVVVLHGQPGTADDWQWVTPRLEDRYTVVAPDRPGYGRTGGPAAGFAGNADATAALLDRLGLERAVIVGHSWAGGAAIAFAVRHPARIAGLVLVSSVAPGEPVGLSDRLLAAPLLGEAIAVTTMGGLGLVLGNRRVQAAAGRRLEGRARDGLVALTRLTRPGSRVWRSFVAEQRFLVAELDGLAPELGGITTPTAVVHGAGDRLVSPDVGRALAGAIPGAAFHLVDGVGHLVPHDRPQAVVDAVDEVAGRGTQTAR